MGAERAPRVAEALAHVVHAFRPTRVYLFGSYAAGRQRPDSDVDLLVVVGEGGGLHGRHRLRALFSTRPYDVDGLVLSEGQFAEAVADPRSFVATLLPESVLLHGA